MPLLHSDWYQRGRFPKDSAQPHLCSLVLVGSGHTVSLPLVIHDGRRWQDYVYCHVR
jgi:hypothetical protein